MLVHRYSGRNGRRMSWIVFQGILSRIGKLRRLEAGKMPSDRERLMEKFG